MANTFEAPYITTGEQMTISRGGQISSEALAEFWPVQDPYYYIGYVQVLLKVRTVSIETEPVGLIGSVQDESVTRREWGTWHLAKQGFVKQRFTIEHDAQEWIIPGSIYPLSRNEAAEPRKIGTTFGYEINMVCPTFVPIATVPNTVVLANPDPQQPNLPREKSVPSYEIEPNCLSLVDNGSKLEFRLQNNSYPRSNDKLLLTADSDRIVVRSFVGADVQLFYEQFTLLVQEDLDPPALISGGGFTVPGCGNAPPLFYPGQQNNDG